MSGIEQVRHTRLASLAASKSVDLIRILDGPKRRSPWLPIGWCGYFPSHGAFLFSSLTRSITLRQAARRSPTGRDPGVPGSSLLLAHMPTTIPSSIQTLLDTNVLILAIYPLHIVLQIVTMRMAAEAVLGLIVTQVQMEMMQLQMLVILLQMVLLRQRLNLMPRKTRCRVRAPH